MSSTSRSPRRTASLVHVFRPKLDFFLSYGYLRSSRLQMRSSDPSRCFSVSAAIIARYHLLGAGYLSAVSSCAPFWHAHLNRCGVSSGRLLLCSTLHAQLNKILDLDVNLSHRSSPNVHEGIASTSSSFSGLSVKFNDHKGPLCYHACKDPVRHGTEAIYGGYWGYRSCYDPVTN